MCVGECGSVCVCDCGCRYAAEWVGEWLGGVGLNSHISYARRKSHKSLASSVCTCEAVSVCVCACVCAPPCVVDIDATFAAASDARYEVKPFDFSHKRIRCARF